MTTNFDFLQKVDKNLYEIIAEAEKLYRDEYFEQCMTQTRRFGENVCKKVLGAEREPDATFDEMLATLKDKTTREEQEKEFLDDLYFLKKIGNTSTHASTVNKDGIKALECLQRAFEVAINYSVYARGASQNILKKRYDTTLLVTGQKEKKTLAEKYTEEKRKVARTEKKITPAKKKKSQVYSMKTSTPKNKFPFFWFFVGISSAISLGMIITLFIIIKF